MRKKIFPTIFLGSFILFFACSQPKNNDTNIDVVPVVHTSKDIPNVTGVVEIAPIGTGVVRSSTGNAK